MAKIKSTIEIAMERAAALGGGADQAQEEGLKRGRALARQTLDAAIEPAELIAGLEAISGDQRAHARRAAAEALLAAWEEGRTQAAPALAALAAGGEAESAAEALVELAAKSAQAEDLFREELAALMEQRFAALGISGSAVHANPDAGTELAALIADFQAQAAAEQQEHLGVLRRALAG